MGIWKKKLVNEIKKGDEGSIIANQMKKNKKEKRKGKGKNILVNLSDHTKYTSQVIRLR
jgi:hypothetical protein